MKWIKSSERLPTKDNNYYAKDIDDIRFILAVRGGKITSYRKAVEWLDESAPVDDVVGGWQEMLRRYRDNNLLDDKYETKNLAFIYAFQMGFKSRQPEVDGLKKDKEILRTMASEFKKRVEELEGKLKTLKKFLGVKNDAITKR